MVVDNYFQKKLFVFLGKKFGVILFKFLITRQMKYNVNRYNSLINRDYEDSKDTFLPPKEKQYYF